MDSPKIREAPCSPSAAARGVVTIGSLFSGIGGLELGLEWAGLGPTIFQVEQDACCQSILARHWPDAQRFDDVRAVGAANLPPVDIICGGFPCQPFSVAGKRAGRDDERHLWPEFARIVRELRPRFVVAENVPGLLTIDGGRVFGVVLGDLAACGYDGVWFTLRASDVGAPHRRERLFIVGWLADSDGAGCGSIRRGWVRIGTESEHGHDVDRCGCSWDSRNEERTNAFLADPRRGDVQREREPGELQDAATRAQSEGHERQRLRDAAGNGGQDAVGDTAQGGLRRGQASRRGGFVAQPGQGGYDGAPKSGLGRAAHGLSRWLDRWPARPGEAQHPFEALRTVEACPNRATRLKALGNAVVPQVAYVVGCLVRAIDERLSTPVAFRDVLIEMARSVR